jgi:hypothetical protein
LAVCGGGSGCASAGVANSSAKSAAQTVRVRVVFIASSRKRRVGAAIAMVRHRVV